MEHKITKSETDRKFYKLLTLKNGLKVLLITESTPSQSLSDKSDMREMHRRHTRRPKSTEKMSGLDAGSLRRFSGNMLDMKPCSRCVQGPVDQLFLTVQDRLLDGCCNQGKFSWSKQKSDRKDKKEKIEDDSKTSTRKSKETAVGDNTADYEEDEDADFGLMSAVSLSVGVGSMSEPSNIPGLAHYLEHMVFMGSEKYSVSNGFDLFLKAHGGSTNARTDYDKTHFHFDIHSDHLCEALDRFAQFFISPLLSRQSMLAEAKVVHSEWAMSLQKERARFEQLLLSMSKPDHPISKFMWGNYDTLVERPQKENINVHEALHEFRKKHYVAQNMALVILSDHNPKEVEECVRSIFQNIPHSNESRQDFGLLGDPFDTPQFRKLYKIIPVQTSHQLELTWSLPSLIKSYRKKPLHYLERVIGDYGAGSIFSALQRRHWVRYMNCGNNESSQDMNSALSIFRILFYLTEEGFKNINKVVTLIFQYLRMLREAGSQEYLWKEIHQVELNEFKYDEQVDQQEYSNLLCNGMLDVEPEDIIISNYVTMEYDPELITSCLDLLTPNRMNLVFRSQEFKSSCQLEEKWFKTLYCVEDIPEEWMKEWMNPPEMQHPELHLPPSNPFIATDFTLKPIEQEFLRVSEPLLSSDVGRVWYKSNYEFQQPKAYYLFYFWCQSMNRTATESCLSDVFVAYLIQSLKEVTCPADLVHLVHGISTFENGFVLRFCGFNHKLKNLFTLYVDNMSCLTIEASRFDTLRRLLIDQYKNMTLCPEQLNLQLHTSHLLSHSWSVMQKLESMECINREMLCSYISKLYEGVYFEALFQGNTSSREALDICDYMVGKLRLKPIVNCSNVFITEILPGSTVLACPNRNQQDSNCVIANYYQKGLAPMKEQLLNEMLVLLMEEPCFEELRTKNQLGYSVSSTVSFVFGVVGFTITVCSQSNKFTMKQLDDHIEEFLSGFYNKIMDMTEDEFESVKYLMSSSREGGDGTLGGQVMRHWEEIVNHEYLFERHIAELEHLEEMTLNDLKCFCYQIIPLDKSLRRKLTIQVVGNTQETGVNNS